MEAPCVYEPDKPAVAAFNALVSDEYRIQTDVLPEPYLGRKDAPIVLLNLNPGFDEHAHLTYDNPYARDAWKKNILHQPLAYPFYFLDPQFSPAGGARWWTQKLKEPIQLAGAHTVANAILCIEYFPYPSRMYKPLPSLVDSQRYSFSLANHAIDRHAVIVLMRAKQRWEHAVPRLTGYPRLFTLNSSQSGAISRKNCVDGFPEIEAILRNGDPLDRELLVLPNSRSPGIAGTIPF